MKFKLLESIFQEDIESTKKQYNYIPENDFDKIIRLDPTFNENRNSVGRYGKWLLGMYKKQNPLEQDPEYIKSLLNTYDALKNDRTVKIEKDINKFKTLADMQTATDNYEEAELSDRQKLRQKRADKNYKVVFKNDTYTIYVPLTWEASVNLGRGTSWCTSDSREDWGKKYWDKYLDEGGNYYIIINNNDPSEKYQFHFESDQFMDARDEHVKLNDFLADDKADGIKEFFEKQGYKIDDYSHDIEAEIVEEYADGYTEVLPFRDVISALLEAQATGLLSSGRNTLSEESFYNLGWFLNLVAGDYDDDPYEYGRVLSNYNMAGLSGEIESKGYICNKGLEFISDYLGEYIAQYMIDNYILSADTLVDIYSDSLSCSADTVGDIKLYANPDTIHTYYEDYYNVDDFRSLADFQDYVENGMFKQSLGDSLAVVAALYRIQIEDELSDIDTSIEYVIEVATQEILRTDCDNFVNAINEAYRISRDVDTDLYSKES